jgi:prepilin-type N-terminal cleavage/methylation domain-containing protein
MRTLRHRDAGLGAAEKPIGRRMENGFSVVELLVVISVMGVILAFSFVSLQQGMPGHQLQGTSSKLASELRLARQKAVTENNNYTITFDPATESYEIWDDDESDGYRSPGERTRVLPLPEGIQFGTINIGASNALTFRPNGSADKGGYVDLYTDCPVRRRVEVVRATGNVIEKRASD